MQLTYGVPQFLENQSYCYKQIICVNLFWWETQAPNITEFAVSGMAVPGELLAIIGSSGAGKTTLLNTLMFRSSSNLLVSGHRSLNGSPVSSTALASLSAYVQQDDLFIGTLTVREHLVFQVHDLIFLYKIGSSLWSRSNVVASYPAGLDWIPGRVVFLKWSFSQGFPSTVRRILENMSPDTI